MVTNGRIKVNPFPNHKFLDSSKLKEFADDNFRFDENDRKFSKKKKKPVGKGEIARCEQFLLFPQCFQRLVLQTRKSHGLSGKELKAIIARFRLKSAKIFQGKKKK